MASVIIPALNEERHITACLESLLKQDQADMEVIVVDNGSRDKTLQIAEEYAEKHPGKVRVIRLDRNMGPGGARNIGAQAARGEVLLFLDADMIFPPDFVKRLIQPILKGEAVSTVHSEEYVSNIANPWVRVQGQTKKNRGSRAGAAFRAIKREIFLAAGGFDPSLHYHDDRTFYYKTGHKAIVVEAICYHNNPDTAREIFRRNYLIGRTLIAVTLQEKGVKGVADVAAITVLRLADLAALPLLVTLIILQPILSLPTSVAALLLTPSIFFAVSTARMKIITAERLREKLLLRLLYAPAYRLIRAAGTVAGVAASLIRGLRVRQSLPSQQPPNHARRPSPSHLGSP
ncbi:MAG: glycosyltransferase family 2 protein [Candidatus Caldarchaeum sp.]